MEKERNSFYAKDRRSWRNWLLKNGESTVSVWLIIYKKESTTPSVYYPAAVEEALSFGWIDSLANKRDGQSYYQYFSRRKPKSNWSNLNKQRVARLIEQNLMMPKGLEMVELAMRTGTWTKLREVDEIMLPEDFRDSLEKNKTASGNRNNFSSSKRGIPEWQLNAKKEETRQKRIIETVELAAINVKPNGAKVKSVSI